ncbi:MAG: hypothetical protein ACTSQY_07000 [Candidatus Odinarchaeia archaeon]
MSWVEKKIKSLDECKELLKFFIERLNDYSFIYMPNTFSSLLEDLEERIDMEEEEKLYYTNLALKKSIEGRNISEKDILIEKIDSILYDLLFEYDMVLPFREIFDENFKERKNKLSNDIIKLVQNLLFTFKSMGGANVVNKNELDQYSTFREYENYFFVFFLEELGLNILQSYHDTSFFILQSIIYQYFSNQVTWEFLTRVLCETYMQGILYECLDKDIFLKEIENKIRIQEELKFRRGERDTVCDFYQMVRKKSDELSLEVNTLMISPEIYGIRAPSFHDIIRWLDDWGLFLPIEDGNQKFHSLYTKTSKLIHGGSNINLLMNNLRLQMNPYDFINYISSISELCLISELNIIKNTSLTKWIKLKEEYFFEDLENKIKNTNMFHLKNKFRNMML